MVFSPKPFQQVEINGSMYHFAEHSEKSGETYFQEGTHGTIHQLVRQADNKLFALKIMKSSFRHPYLLEQANQLQKYTHIKGLSACDWMIIEPINSKQLVKEYSELLYAIVMPWVDGVSWSEILFNKQAIRLEESRQLGRAFLAVMIKLEKERIAHSQLSAENLIVDDKLQSVECIELEHFYSAHLEVPDLWENELNGYMSQYQLKREAKMDRFAGGILLAEMLAWHDVGIREAAWGNSYFDPSLSQTDERFEILKISLENTYGLQAGELISRLWYSKTIDECPSFQEWNNMLLTKHGDSEVEQDTVSALDTKQEQTVEIHEKIKPISDMEEAENESIGRTKVESLLETNSQDLKEGHKILGIFDQKNDKGRRAYHYMWFAAWVIVGVSSLFSLIMYLV